MKFIPAKEDHLDLLELRKDEHASFACDDLAKDHIKGLIGYSSCGTAVYKGKIIAIFGFFQIWPGVLEVWILPSIYVQEHPIPFLRAAKQYIKGLIRDYNPHRVQSCSIDNMLHEGWMRFTGFEKEGTLRQYTANKVDYCQWAIVRDT